MKTKHRVPSPEKFIEDIDDVLLSNHVDYVDKPANGWKLLTNTIISHNSPTYNTLNRKLKEMKDPKQVKQADEIASIKRKRRNTRRASKFKSVYMNRLRSNSQFFGNSQLKPLNPVPKESQNNMQNMDVVVRNSRKSQIMLPSQLRSASLLNKNLPQIANNAVRFAFY